MTNLHNPFAPIMEQLTHLERQMGAVLELLGSSTPTSSTSQSSWIGIKEAAELLGISPKTIYNNLSRYPHSKPHGRLRFKRADLEKLLEAKTRSTEKSNAQFTSQRYPLTKPRSTSKYKQ